MKRNLYVLMVLVTCLVGCSAMGVVESNDPAVKLEQAKQLFSNEGDRPLPAEKLIREALAIYQARGDTLGVAEANRVYGFFFRATSVTHWEKVFRAGGFLDKSATFDQRLQKSIEYFDQAKRLFESLSRYDKISNVELNRGGTFAAMKDVKSACAAFDASLAAQQRYSELNPNAQISLPKDVTSFAELIAKAKRSVPCEPGQK